MVLPSASPVKLDFLSRLAVDALFFYYRISRTRHRPNQAEREVLDRRSEFYVTAWEEAAGAVGGSFHNVSGSLFEIRCGEVRLRIRRNDTSLDDPVTVAIAMDKLLSCRLVAARGVPVPRNMLCRFDDLSTAKEFMAQVGKPCVVKPARYGIGGGGVTTGVSGGTGLAAAMGYARSFDRDVIIEEMIEGDLYRLLYLDGELLDAVLRSPPTVRGDGSASITTLIERENMDRWRSGSEAGQSVVRIDRELKHTLRSQGYSLHSIPAVGETVKLKNVVNDNRGEDNRSAVDMLGPALIEQGAEAAAAIGLRLAGVDVITTDPGIPLAESRGAVIEVNSGPGLYYHYMQKDGRVPVATRILQRLVDAVR